MRRIGIERCLSCLGSRFDVRPLLHVMLCQTVRGTLCRSCLQIVQVSVCLLIIGQTVSHMIQNFFGEFLGLRAGHIRTQPVCIETHLVHTDQTDGGEMIIKASQISLGVRIQSLVQKFGDHASLDLQTSRRNIHHAIQSLVEIILVGGQISDSRHIDRHNTDASGTLAGSEETAGFLPEFSQIKPQTAAHTSYIAGFHVGVNIVREIRRAVFGSHLKQKSIILGI